MEQTSHGMSEGSDYASNEAILLGSKLKVLSSCEGQVIQLISLIPSVNEVLSSLMESHAS